MTAQPLRYVRDHLSELVDSVESEHDRVEITRNGRVVAVLMSPDEVSVLEETLSLLMDAAAMDDIAAARRAVARGEGVRGVEAVRALRP